MAGDNVLVVHNASSNPPQLRCIIKPCKNPLPEDLASLLSPKEVTAFGSYAATPVGAAPPNPLTVLHALAGDAGPDMRLLPAVDDPGARDAFRQWHQADAAAGRCIVIRYPTRDLELVLVPVITKTAAVGTPSPCYWGFTVAANLLPVLAPAIQACKLLSVFDIDETLLMAHTVDSLSSRLGRISREREAKAAELLTCEAAGDADRISQLQATILALKTEQVLLRKDYEMLSSFRHDAACRVVCDGQVFEPSWECSTMASGVQVTRPVVRLELGGRPVLFTRVFPEAKSTSLLIRPRPGWESLRAYLSGEDALQATGAKRERWEVYLCTTAEREYAWEAWRLLDPQASIFPHNQLSWRMLCVSHPQKKDLLNVLRKAAVDAAAASGLVPRCASDPQFVTDQARASRPPLGCPAPLCVVVDDRLDVWEEDSRRAVLQVMPFHPHKEAAALDLGSSRCPPAAYSQALDSEGELPRVGATLRDIRAATYLTLNKSVRPEVERLTRTGVTDRLQDSAASILASLLVPLKSVPQLLADSPHRPPAALGSTEKDDRASDLRLLVADGTMETHAAAAAAAGAAAGAGGGEPSTRKRRLEPATAANAAAAAAAGGAAEQQQQPAKKRKKEKQRLFDGVDLAGIMSAIGNQQQQQQQQQQQPVDEDDPPLRLEDSEEEPAQQQQQQMGGYNQLQQQQQQGPPKFFRQPPGLGLGSGSASGGMQQPPPPPPRQQRLQGMPPGYGAPLMLGAGMAGDGNMQQQQQQGMLLQGSNPNMLLQGGIGGVPPGLQMQQQQQPGGTMQQLMGMLEQQQQHQRQYGQHQHQQPIQSVREELQLQQQQQQQQLHAQQLHQHQQLQYMKDVLQQMNAAKNKKRSKKAPHNEHLNPQGSQFQQGPPAAAGAGQQPGRGQHQRQRGRGGQHQQQQQGRGRGGHAGRRGQQQQQQQPGNNNAAGRGSQGRGGGGGRGGRGRGRHQQQQGGRQQQ